MNKLDDKWNWTEDTLKSIILRIIQRRNEYIVTKENELDEGIIMGFNFVLDIIKIDLEIRGYNFDEFISDNEK